MRGVGARAGALWACALALFAGATGALAAECSNSDALGTSRVLVVDPAEHQHLGTMQYRETLPLADKEVVLTFDDGPLNPYSQRVLDALAAECVKATYFLVGRMVRSNPAMVRKIAEAGHTIGTHTESHLYRLDLIDPAKAEQEVNVAIAATAEALGPNHAVAPFFRFPGLRRTEHLEGYLGARSIMTWSADFPADDWTKISAAEITHRALTRLEAKGKGILLLHDIQPATALALPGLLRELKSRGFKIVHVVPTSADQPVTATLPEQWRPVRSARAEVVRLWPRTIEPLAADTPATLAAPSPDSLGVADAAQAASAVHLAKNARRSRTARTMAWPKVASLELGARDAALPAPASEAFRYQELMHPTGYEPRPAVVAESKEATKRARAQAPRPTTQASADPRTPEAAVETSRPFFLFRLFERSEPAPRGPRSSELSR